MSDFKKPKTKEEYLENFGQIKPLMNATMAYYESSRCLFCYDAPCVKACPTGIDIPLFIRQINNGNLSGAAKTIYEQNYFGNTCGKVCPTEVLCEGACVYNEQDVKPIEIGRLQNYATEKAIKSNLNLPKGQIKRDERVAVIGAGPAGISCACELSKLGYQVDVFESKEKAGGLALYGTAPYKIRNEEIEDEISYLKTQFGFKLYTNHAISNASDIQKLESKYDAIFLGVGMGGTRNINIPGEGLDNCVGATEFIESLKMNPLTTAIGKKVVVLGGGNTAMDAASESARMGADEVTLLYRRSKDEMGAYHFELDLAKSVGVKAVFEVQVLEIIGDRKVGGVKCTKTHSKDGILENVNGSEFTIDCDMLIKATGQQKYTPLLDLIPLNYDRVGRITTNNNFQCSNPKYFAGGDALNGGAEVVNACEEAKKAAIEIDSFLQHK